MEVYTYEENRSSFGCYFDISYFVFILGSQATSFLIVLQLKLKDESCTVSSGTLGRVMLF